MIVRVSLLVCCSNKSVEVRAMVAGNPCDACLGGGKSHDYFRGGGSGPLKTPHVPEPSVLGVIFPSKKRNHAGLIGGKDKLPAQLEPPSLLKPF